MENISLKTIPDDVRNFLDMEDGVRKNIKYRKDMIGILWLDTNLCIKDDGTIHYSEVTRNISKAQKYYTKQVKKIGFTFTTKKKLEFWFNTSVNSFIADASTIFKALKIDWWTNEYSQFLTKGLMEKVIAGKITNPTDFARAVLKLYRVKNGSHKLLLKAIPIHDFTKRKMLRGLQVSKNFNHYLEFFLAKELDQEKRNIWSILQDMEEQALQLECKIDYTWSIKRIHNEHTKMTMEIMNYLGQELSDTPLEHLLELKEAIPVLPNMRLLVSEKEAFIEGFTMNHCVYTNYWHRVVDRQYLIFHIKMNDVDWTLGLNLVQGLKYGLYWNQLYGYKNAWPPDDVSNTIRKWFDDIRDDKKIKQVCKKLAHIDTNSYVALDDI